MRIAASVSVVIGVVSLVVGLGFVGRSERAAVARAMAAYAQGRFLAARADFEQVAAVRGDRASPGLWFDVALARLCAGDLRAAELAAERAAARAGPRAVAQHARREFVVGNAAFARAEGVAEQATGPEADPVAWDLALAYCDAAIRAWSAAVVRGSDRADRAASAAARNVERALRRRAEWVEAQAAAAAARRAKKEADGGAGGETPPPPEQLPDLPDDLLQRLLEKLLANQLEKDAARDERRGAGAGVEQDW